MWKILLLSQFKASFTTVFSIPGLGRLAFEAINNNDFPIMVGTVLVFTGMYVGFNFITDLLYAYIDPRIRYA